MKYLQLKCPPPIVMIISIFIAFIASQRDVSFIQQQIADINNVIWPLGFVLIGGIIALAGVKEFISHHTTLNPLDPFKSTSLVVTGIYKFTRNPMYLGMLLVLLGCGDFLDTLLAYSGALFFFVYIDFFQIKPEEEVMQEKFGGSFSHYCRKVRRWL